MSSVTSQLAECANNTSCYTTNNTPECRNTQQEGKSYLCDRGDTHRPVVSPDVSGAEVNAGWSVVLQEVVAGPCCPPGSSSMLAKLSVNQAYVLRQGWAKCPTCFAQALVTTMQQTSLPSLRSQKLRPDVHILARHAFSALTSPCCRLVNTHTHQLQSCPPGMR